MNNIKKMRNCKQQWPWSYQKMYILANSLSKKFNVTLFCLKEKVDILKLIKRLKL